MPQDATTIRPLGLANVLKLLARRPMPTPGSVPAAAPIGRDSYAPSSTGLQNNRFAGNAELGAIAAGRAVLNAQTSPETLALVQQALTDMAFNVPAAEQGKLGISTIAAIKNFQVMAGLKADGSLGPKTLAALDRFAPAAGKTAWSQGSNPGPVPSPDLGNGKKARVVVSISQHRAFMFDKNGNLEKIYGVRTGRDYVDAQGKRGLATQPGVKVIAGKNADPTEVSNRLWPESDGKAFGTRLLGLDNYDVATGTSNKGQYAGQELHGTYSDASIGRDFSHGCVGMRNQDIEEVFSKVRNGELIRFDA